MRFGLLFLLGVLWSLRLAAMKSAGQSGIPPQVVVPVSILGIAIFYTAITAVRGCWPPLNRTTVIFYSLTAVLGFVLPFILEIIVAPRLPLFTFVVIISTMPILTVLLSAFAGVERLRVRQICTVLLGFLSALLIVLDTAKLPEGNASSAWLLAAFAVPVFYAANTVFVASHWPKEADAIQIAHAQAVIVSAAAVAGSLFSGRILGWQSAAGNMPAIGAIVFCEGLALLLYLRLTRNEGPAFVSLANYISLFVAAILDAILFGGNLSWLSGLAGIVLIVALIMRSHRNSCHS